MRREFMCDGKTYHVVGYSEAALRGPAPKSESVLRFWDADGVGIGSVRNRTGLRIDDLTDEEMCLHLAEVLDEGRGEGTIGRAGESEFSDTDLPADATVEDAMGAFMKVDPKKVKKAEEKAARRKARKGRKGER